MNTNRRAVGMALSRRCDASGEQAEGSWRMTKDGRQGMLEEHGQATVRADEGRRWRRSRAGRGSNLVFRLDHGVSRGKQALSESRQASTPGRGEETVVTDLDEVMG
jgi:hypothetical protein